MNSNIPLYVELGPPDEDGYRIVTINPELLLPHPLVVQTMEETERHLERTKGKLKDV